MHLAGSPVGGSGAALWQQCLGGAVLPQPSGLGCSDRMGACTDMRWQKRSRYCTARTAARPCDWPERLPLTRGAAVGAVRVCGGLAPRLGLRKAPWLLRQPRAPFSTLAPAGETVRRAMEKGEPLLGWAAGPPPLPGAPLQARPGCAPVRVHNLPKLSAPRGRRRGARAPSGPMRAGWRLARRQR